MSNQSSHPWRKPRISGSYAFKPLAAPPPPEGVDAREFDAIIRAVPAMGEHNMRRMSYE